MFHSNLLIHLGDRRVWRENANYSIKCRGSLIWWFWSSRAALYFSINSLLCFTSVFAGPITLAKSITYTDAHMHGTLKRVFVCDLKKVESQKVLNSIAIFCALPVRLQKWSFFSHYGIIKIQKCLEITVKFLSVFRYFLALRPWK